MIETSPALRITAFTSLVAPTLAATAAAVEADPYAGLAAGAGTFTAVLLLGWLAKAHPLQTVLLLTAAFFAATVAGTKTFVSTLAGGEEA